MLQDLGTESVTAILRLEHLLGRAFYFMIAAEKVHFLPLRRGWLLGLRSRNSKVLHIVSLEDLVVLLRG